MKIALLVSVILNLVLLGNFFFQEENPPLERIVIQDNVVIQEKIKEVPVEVKPKKAKAEYGDLTSDVPVPHDVTEFDMVVEQAESQRREAYMSRFNIPEEKINKHERMRENYFADTHKIYGINPMELSIQDRRKLLDLEENYQKSVQDLYGKKTWEKLEKFRIEYNNQIMKRVRDDNSPAILLSP